MPPTCRERLLFSSSQLYSSPLYAHSSVHAELIFIGKISHIKSLQYGSILYLAVDEATIATPLIINIFRERANSVCEQQLFNYISSSVISFLWVMRLEGTMLECVEHLSVYFSSFLYRCIFHSNTFASTSSRNNFFLLPSL
jgi:hypothetical protein